MKSVIVIDADGKLDYKMFQKIIDKYCNSYNFFVAAKQKQVLDNAKFFCVEKQSSADQMINLLLHFCDTDDLIVVRKLKNNYARLESALEKNVKELEIGVFRKKTKKLQRQFYGAANQILNAMFNFKLFFCDCDIIMFPKSIIVVLKQQPNASFYTKINSWQGYTIKYFEDDISCKFKAKSSIKKEIIKVSCYSTIFVALILCMILIKQINTSFLYTSFGVLFVIVLFVLLQINVLKMYIKRRYGEPTAEIAKIKEEENGKN